MNYVITRFIDAGQATAIFKSLKTTPSQAEYLDNPELTSDSYCWVVMNGELFTDASSDEHIGLHVERISATLYCVLKNI